MSGGSHNYIYCQIENELCGQMEDLELDDLIKDIANLAHDLEWYHSADISKDSYLKCVSKFKMKWFASDRSQRLKSYIDASLKDLEKSLYSLSGVQTLLEPAVTWIDCNERLPNNSEPVLVTFKDALSDFVGYMVLSFMPDANQWNIKSPVTVLKWLPIPD